MTPMMRQYRDLKTKYADAFLFFRLGDFYEMFFEDAVEASRLLSLTLTKRHETPMCGVPFHAVESYLGRLTRLGKKVAICEQLSDPSLPGIVSRDVIRVVTPGTTFDERIVDQKSNRFIVALQFGKGGIGLAAADLTTGLFLVAALKDFSELKEELFRLSPAECVIEPSAKELPEFLQQFEKLPVFPHQCWDEPVELLAKHFAVKDLRGFGMGDDPSVTAAAALLLSYLKDTQKSELPHLSAPRLMERHNGMMLDETAIRNLELFSSLREGSREGSLFATIDATKTSMGGRTLRSWLLTPLHNKETIDARLATVTEILNRHELAQGLGDALSGVLDLERLLAKVALGTGGARDVLGIAISLKSLGTFATLLQNADSELFKTLHAQLAELSPLEALRDRLLAAVVEAPPLSVRDGGMIREGVSPALDELKIISREGKGYIQKLQEEEIAKTGIPSLKIRFTSVFGYFIEVTKANLKHVPPHYTRKQTLVNAERFITPELKEFEEKVLGAEEKMKQLEYEIFLSLREEVKSHTRDIQKAAHIMGTLDVLRSFAETAAQCRYIRPEIVDEDSALEINNGRHPVVERLADGKFVPNDVLLMSGKTILITGPNMGGKSTYLRQAALIVLLAHIGSFVPADAAKIPLIDRIFTRVGASDNLVRGQSTFMVEMQETAQILHYATKNSLIILDEIGRGTSTYDGVSLAWAILEHIHDHISARTLFATHYHELISVAERLPHAENFSVGVKEDRGKGIIFLYRVLPGAIDRSYGIEVARLAGLPKEVVSKAKNILHDLEEGVLDQAISARAKSEVTNENQLDIFAERKHRVIEELEKTDINKMTPFEALKKMYEWKKDTRT